METKNRLLKLRKNLGLSQGEFAERLHLTRQAVSRWENGDTVPSTDTLKLIAENFGVSADHLLGYPAGICQSCGMELTRESDRGTTLDGSKAEEYCAFCYQQGSYTRDFTMAELIEHNLQHLDEWNEAAGLQLTEQEARKQLMDFLPSLKRWRG